MSTKEVMLTLKDDKQDLQKQLGCMNGLFQIFDRRFLLGQRRHGQNQKRPSPGQSDNGEKELRNPSERVKEKAPKVVMKDNRVSVEKPRNSFSSTSSSTATSSLESSKKVQKEVSSSCQSVVSEPSSSPFIPRKQSEMFMTSPDIRDVVKDSMTREPRAVSIKKAAQEVRVGPAVKHIDSPRPFPHQKPVSFERNVRNDRNLAKLREIQWGPEKTKEMSRFSCDGRESRYQLKSNMKIKELPRLSLDSRQGYNSNSANDPISNRRTSSSVVARLMGLEALTTTTDDNQTLKAKREESILNSNSPKKDEKLKHDCLSVSPQRGVKVSHVITRIPLETAPWKQEGGRGPQKSLFKSKEGPAKTEAVSRSIYGEIEKRLTEHEYKTAGKDLRALKQILEAMQKTKSRLENKERHFENISIDDRRSQKSDQTVSPIVNVISPHKVQHADATQRETKRSGRPRSTSIFPEHSGSVSPRTQRSKNSIRVPLPDSSRPKKQPSKQPTLFGSTTRNPKAKPTDPLQDSTETRNLSQVSDTVSFQSESSSRASQHDSEVTSTEWVHEVISPFQERSTVDHTKHTTEQPSPVSVLDVFYTEDTPSPVKKKSFAFSDDEKLHFEEAQDQTRIDYLADHYSEFNNMKLKGVKHLVHQTELLNTNIDRVALNHTVISPYESEAEDDRYIEDILTASGCLKDLDRATTIVQLNPTGGLINPELFHVLEKTKGCTNYGYNKKNTRSKLRRKLVFDTLNDVLGQKLVAVGPFGPHKGKILNGKKLMKEMCSEIKSLQNNSEVCIYDEDDEVINIINADANKRSQDWDEYYYQVPGLVLDIERMIFKDLVNEVVNGHVTNLQD
ncbi:protein LONGIFOLIA 1-like [Rutidosis leptorrhynchoides]|uniref:protein LONGIFOLIA 1-like n=1 Tax=Rutidosis leptorrhynchoides TaxID=125765 RepID=UPI003A9A404B